MKLQVWMPVFETCRLLVLETDLHLSRASQLPQHPNQTRRTLVTCKPQCVCMSKSTYAYSCVWKLCRAPADTNVQPGGCVGCQHSSAEAGDGHEGDRAVEAELSFPSINTQCCEENFNTFYCSPFHKGRFISAGGACDVMWYYKLNL